MKNKLQLCIYCLLLPITLCAQESSSLSKTSKPAIYVAKALPSASLYYQINTQQKLLNVSGNAKIDWINEGNRFSIHGVTRANLFGKILEVNSEGSIDQYGLIPQNFFEKRLGKEPSQITFDYSQKKIFYGQSDKSYPLLLRTQDRSSVTWQLAAILQASHEKPKIGQQWQIQVVSRDDADLWTFQIQQAETLETPIGRVPTIHISRLPSGGKDRKLDIWFATQDYEYYPIKIRLDDDRQTVEQIISKIEKRVLNAQ